MRLSVGHARENLAAEFKYIANELGVEPIALALAAYDAVFPERAVQQFVVGLLEEHARRSLRVGRVCDDHIEIVLVFGEEFKAVADVQRELGAVEALGRAGQKLLAHVDHILLLIRVRRSSVQRSKKNKKKHIKQMILYLTSSSSH